jgi:hypothetical protein
MEIASNSKTISAMALIAAINDLKGRSPSLNLNVDSLIWKYLPATWTIPNSIKEITFRDLLQHTSGLNPSYNVKTYGDCKKLIQGGRTQSRGTYAYHNGNYSLMRIIIPYVVDGPQAYSGFSDSALDDYTTAAYRQYVRGRILDPIGLTVADAYWTGIDPVTVLFDSTSTHRPATNRVNVFLGKPTTAVCGNCIDCPSSCGGIDLDETPTLHVREAGAGRWELSADEYALLMSKFWSGAIIPIDDMLGDNAVAYGGGMGNTEVTIPDRGTVWRYGHGGAGAFVQTIWITMAGYTAVVHSNTGLNFSLAALVESAMISAFMP